MRKKRKLIVGKGERGKQRTKRKIEVEDMEEEGKRETEHRNKTKNRRNLQEWKRRGLAEKRRWSSKNGVGWLPEKNKIGEVDHARQRRRIKGQRFFRSFFKADM